MICLLQFIASGWLKEGRIRGGQVEAGGFGDGFASTRIVAAITKRKAHPRCRPALRRYSQVVVVALVAGRDGADNAIANSVDTGDFLGRQGF